LKENEKINLHFVEKGIVFTDVEFAWIDEEAEIGQGTYIGPFVTIGSGVKIGKDCKINKNATINDSAIEDGVIIGEDSLVEKSRVGTGTEVLKSVIKESSIGENSNIGPFAYLRPGSRIGNNVKIGDFVEIKNSIIGNGTKVSHLTYVGDSDLGEGINLGCGVVFVNYDGKEKHRSTVEDGAFIGCNVNIISPVKIGKNAYVAAGTTVTRDVPPGSLGIGRQKQEHHEGWVSRRGLIDR